MESLSEGTKWLLDFANWGRKEAVLNPPGERMLEKLKRKPEFKEEKALPKTDKSIPLIVDTNGWVWQELLRDVTLIGRINTFPLDDFKVWILKAGIPPYKPEKLWVEETYISSCTADSRKVRRYTLDLKNKTKEDEKIQKLLQAYQVGIRRVLNWITRGGKPPAYVAAYLKISRFNLLAPGVNWETGETKFKYPAIIPQAVAAYLLDFWVNQKELHPLFKECPTCGRFRLEEKKGPGRSQIFCCNKCKELFHRLPKEEKKELMREYRSYHRKENQKKEYNELSEFLEKGGDFTKVEASKEAEEWIYKQEKTMKQYMKYWGL